MLQTHIQKFKECYPVHPEQKSYGFSPQDYLKELNRLCGEPHLYWPENNHPMGLLGRSELIDLCRDENVNVLVGYAAVMAWGKRNYKNYRSSLTGESKKHLELILHQIRTSTSDRKTDFAAMQKAAVNVKGLGISYYTKLLFFFRKNDDAYILDQFTAKSAQLLFKNCRINLSGHYPTEKNTPEIYEEYCSNLKALGAEMNPEKPWGEDVVELAMFDPVGGPWRKYLLSQFPRKAK